MNINQSVDCVFKEVSAIVIMNQMLLAVLNTNASGGAFINSDYSGVTVAQPISSCNRKELEDGYFFPSNFHVASHRVRLLLTRCHRLITSSRQRLLH